MKLRQCKQVILDVVSAIGQNFVFSFAAALSYYFVLAFFPALITATTIVGLLPIPNLANVLLKMMAQFVPPESWALLEKVAGDVTSGRHDALLSFGLLGTLWTCSSAFATKIEALNVAYHVPESRPFWKTRLLAFQLTFLVGFLVVVGFAIMIAGPHFGAFLAAHFRLSRAFAGSWPLLQHGIAAILIVLAIEGLYLMAPDLTQSFSSSLPGAIFAVVGWMVLSDGLSFYFQKFAQYNRTYGFLGGGIALLVWLYWTSFIVLVGAELNFAINKLRSTPARPE